MLSRAKHRNAISRLSLMMCCIFLVEVSCAETMRVPVRDLEKLNEEKRTYVIETKDDLKLYASEVVWADTLVTILELDPTYHADSTAAIFGSLPMKLPIEDIESLGRVRFDKIINMPIRDLETLNERIRKTYRIQTMDGEEYYANGVLWSDTLVTITELDRKFYPDSTAAIFGSLPVTLRVEDIESIGRVTTDNEEMALVILLIVGIPIVVGLVVREFFVQIIPED